MVYLLPLLAGCGLVGEGGGCIVIRDSNPNGPNEASGFFPSNTKSVTGTVLIEQVSGEIYVHVSALSGITETGLRLEVVSNQETLKFALKGCTGNQTYVTSVPINSRTWSTATIVNPTLPPPGNVYVTAPLN